MRLDNRDEKRKSKLTALEVLTLLKNIKPFPVEPHKGWKLHSFLHGCRIWTQEISPNNSDLELEVFAAYAKVRVPPQLILQILKDVTKTSSWKPGCLAISITSSKPLEPELGTRGRGVMTPVPVNHDIVMEESSYAHKGSGGFFQFLVPTKNCSVLTVTKEYKRYWYREDNGVCWHLQMSESTQEWVFFLAQPVEEVDRCLLTVVGYTDESNQTGASYISQILGSFKDYILYRKVQTTSLLDIKLPHSKPMKRVEAQTSSDERNVHSAGKRLYLSFRSLVKNPSFGADKVQSAKRQLVRSASILRHRYLPFSDVKRQSSAPAASLKTASLDRSFSHDVRKISSADDLRPRSHSVSGNGSEVEAKAAVNSAISDNNTQGSGDNNNVLKVESATAESETTLEGQNEEVKGQDEEVKDEKEASESEEKSEVSEASDKIKDMEKLLDEDFSFEQAVENDDMESSGSREGIQHIVTANQTAAELLSVAVQASNIDLNKSIEEQVLLSGGWMFCGLENDVVVLKKISVNQNVQCYLGKGVIQATPQTVWNAIKNPRTKFTYDESLKKVDVLEIVSESVKIVYYYHEVLQLFKKECYDMVVMQSEKVDGEKYLISMQSEDRQGVTSPDGTLRVKVLPSGWIIEPIKREKKVFSMATYIMQIDFGSVQPGLDRAPYEDLISKQPLSIAYLRQYLRPSALWVDKQIKS